MKKKPESDENAKPAESGDEKLPPFLRKLHLPGCSMWSAMLWCMVGALLIAQLWGQGAGESERLSYTTFREYLDAGHIAEVTLVERSLEGEFAAPVQYELETGEIVTLTTFTTHLPVFGIDALLPDLEARGVHVTAKPPMDISWPVLLINILPWAILIGGLYFMSRQMRGRGQNIFSIGQSRAKLYDRRKEHTTFDDVAGAEGAKGELQEIILFLKEPERFQRLGGEIPRGVLLVGPPGTGKTLMARAMAGEAEVPFFSITGSDFMEMFVGVGASRVRDLFNDAKKAAPSIVFIDELDSIGRRRGAGLGGGHDEREQTLNQLLSELDGFEPNEGVIVVAATNRPDILDTALLRPGRFDRRIAVDLPTLDARHAILKIHARNKPIADAVDLKRLARGTPGFSGADLENLLNEAALLAARRNVDEIAREDIEEARDKVLMGLQRENLALTDQECEFLAYHEGGHALVAAILPRAEPIHKVTIVPRGRAMGMTQQLPRRDKYLYSRAYMEDRLAVMLGGRAAERLVFDAATSGAADDLKQATRLARKMVLDWGMSDRFGHIAFGEDEDQVFLGEDIARRRQYSEATAREIDEEIRAILDGAYEVATATLREHREALDRLAELLLEHEQIPGAEVLALVGREDDLHAENAVPCNL